MISEDKFGAESATVVVEESLNGIELSVFLLTDGKSYKILPAAKDYKRIGEGDKGLNTGGMGAVSPVPFADDEFIKKVEEKVVIPTINGLIKEVIDYRGFIFIGLMNDKCEKKVIEYNCRMGDPETEAEMPRLKNDLVALLENCARGTLGKVKLRTDKRTATTIFLVSGGYPGDYQKGKIIRGLDRVRGCMVFHAGTAVNTAGETVTSGGRVIAVTSLGKDIASAVRKSKRNAKLIDFEGKYYRRDIGKDLL
jgi:phosphoribosylamine--glycine ligase